MQKQIEEVMALVEKYGDECEAHGHRAGINTYQAIHAKLSELLPVWQPIESAPKDGREIWAFNGEKARMKWNTYHEFWEWADDLLSDADAYPEPPNFWLPLPKDPE